SEGGARPPPAATVNFRAGVPQFGRPRCASDWPRPPFCATGARSRHPHPACAQFRFAASLASPNHLPAPASSRLPPLSAVSPWPWQLAPQPPRASVLQHKGQLRFLDEPALLWTNRYG